MNELTETHPGSWVLILGPRSGPNGIRITLLTFIARLALSGPVRVLDCGNQFNAYHAARCLHGRRDLLERIHISRAFTCHQLFSSLEKSPEPFAPFIVLDFLHSFYDESVPFAERSRLIKRSISHLHRLSAFSGGAVSVHPPALITGEAEILFTCLSASAPEFWTQALPAPIEQPGRLF